MELNHGGDVYSAENTGAVDFSANINPLGLPKSVKQTLETAAADCVHYPDPLCRELRAAIGAYEGVAAENVFCAGGAAEILYRIAWALRPRRALVASPTFSEYRLAVACTGGEVCTCPLHEEMDFAPGEDFIACIDGSVDLVFLCNPNNPTGVVVGREFVQKTAEKCARTGATLVVDECFMDFVRGGEENCSAKPLLSDYENLLVLKAFTKIFSMPGVRLGYCLTANRQLIEKLALCGQPWSVSVFAQAAGAAAAKELAFVAESRRFVEKERAFLCTGLSGLGLRVFEGTANFLLFRASGVSDLRERLLRRGYLIRNCANFDGLDDNFYRIAVRTHAENSGLLRALECSL
ncbi:threonine-phosphate decarboxylase CobD [Ethanoligenens sp.]|uniref:threonine-phosphate decarboxylase CobD n=1 Tax=Ethanoligenens sp. TaxID=2099655 RepID=UPI0039EC0FE5